MMPLLAFDQTTLNEVLEVRAEPLFESELWSLLLQASLALQSIMDKVAKEKLLDLTSTLCPDTIILCLNGRIKFGVCEQERTEKHFRPPEYSIKKKKITDNEIEKMLVYSLGMCVLTSAENEAFTIEFTLSFEIESLMCQMTEDNYKCRVSLEKIIQICNKHVDVNVSQKCIQSLAEEIVGPYGLEQLPEEIPLVLPKYSFMQKEYGEHPFDPGPLKIKSKCFEDSVSEKIDIVKRCHLKSLESQNLFQNHSSDRRINQDASNTSFKTAWSPSFSAPDFKTLLDLNEMSYLTSSNKSIEKLKSFSSMPTLHGLSEELEQDLSLKENVFSFQKSEGNIGNKCYSSQGSLTQGTYTLDSDKMNRCSSFASISQSFKSAPHYLYQTTDLQSLQNICRSNLGPEFIQVTENPDLAVIDISPPRLGPLLKGTRYIIVILPNSQKVQTTIQVASKGKELFDQIACYLQIKETLYFGLTQLQGEDHVFLDLDSKLLKYAPTGWKDEKLTKKKLEFILYFKVKFFVNEPCVLKQSITRHSYYLQIRQDILSGYMHCSDEALFVLTGHALQAEFGNYESSSSQYFQIEHYLPRRVLSRINKDACYQHLSSIHKSNYGNCKEVAELEFLKKAKDLQEYGVLFYKVSRSKKVKNDYVWFGICIKGLIILEPKGNLRATVHKQSWNFIKEFNFENKKFVVKPKDQDANPKMVFYCNNYRRAKYLFRICQSFHRFHAFNQRTGLDIQTSCSILSNDNSIKDVCKNSKDLPGFVDSQRKEVCSKQIKVDSVYCRSFDEDMLLSNCKISLLERENESKWISTSEKFDSMKLKYAGIGFIDEDLKSVYSERSIDVHSPKVKGQLPVPVPISTQSTYHSSEKMLQKNHNDGYVSSMEGIFSESTCVSESCENFERISVGGLKRTSGFNDLNKIDISDKNDNENVKSQLVSENLHKKESNIHHEGLTKDTIEEIEVEIEKVKKQSFGISIVGGIDSTLPLGGIFVKSLLFGSPAQLTGKIREGDRILSVNGTSLENMTHLEAVEILKHAPERTTIVIDRGIALSLDHISESVNSVKSVLKKDYVFKVDVEKGDNGLGLSLVGGRNSEPVFNGMLMIKKMYPQQPIEMSRMFQIGDVILAVNNEVVDGMTLQEALSVIRNAPKKVQIVAKRLPENEIPNVLLDHNKLISSETENMKENEIFLGRKCSLKVKNIAKKLLQNIECSVTESFDGCSNSSDIGSDTDEPLESLTYSKESTSPFLSKDPHNALFKQNNALVFDMEQQVECESFSNYSKSPLLTSSPSILEKSVKSKKSKKSCEKVFRNIFVSNDEMIDEANVNYFKSQSQNDNIGTLHLENENVGILLSDINKISEKSIRNNLIENLDYKSEKNVENVEKEKTVIREEVVNQFDQMICFNRRLFDADGHSMSDNNEPAKSVHSSQSSLVVSAASLPGSPMLKHLGRWKREPSTESSLSKKSTGILSAGEVILVQLEKKESGLGLTLGSENIDGESAIFIKKIVEGSVAEECGKLLVGDRLLCVNGRNVEHANQKEVVSIFRSLTGTVTLECFRPPKSLLNLKSSVPKLNLSATSSSTSSATSSSTSSDTNRQVNDLEKFGKSSEGNVNCLSKNFSLEFAKDVSTMESKELTFNSSLQLLDSYEETHNQLNLNKKINISCILEPNSKKLEKKSLSDNTNFEFNFKTFQENNVFEETSSNQSNIISKQTHEFKNLPVEVGWEDKDDVCLITGMDKEGVIKPSCSSSESYNFETEDYKNPFSIHQTSGIPLFKQKSQSSLNSSHHVVAMIEKKKEVYNSHDFYIERKLFNYYTKERLKKMINAMENKIDSIDVEFSNLRQIKSSGTCTIGNRASNRVKNRIKNIIPYDHNRVELHGSEESDYINASHIKLAIGEDIMRYIITQAPLEHTVNDFWRCIWENKIELIVMLNNEFTSENIKFPCYWPESANLPMRILEKFEIILLHEEDYGVYKYRQIQFKNIKMDKSLFVTQAAFSQWRENSIPEKMTDYLGFMKFIQTYRNSSVTLVHCSTGTGRSATFVIMDCVWNALERDVKFDVSHIAKSLKEQRQFVLQNKEDYMFCIKVTHHLLLDSIHHYD
ncbi:tyrosine-protein phosphatase non-receptor type 13 isoform X1 [Hydra vulgaris]|uniref:tyrosine-protein phosphatase non-receptor type 13 isoform X1 n=1 Tax=Hydra vulgaris TaxID=6087 RepID=UPI0006418116|nr:tyrosine-protein phosphatase non-receptor type 13 [Hydra vulgaris]